MGRRHEFGFPSKIASRRRFQFLAFFKCHELPLIFFERICQPSKVWNDEGEIVECSETIIGLDSDLENIFQEAKDNGIIKCFETLLSQTYVVDESWKQWLSFNSDDRARRNIEFNILELVLKAFPTPYTEISWMEVESQMLDIVQTTCVPFLCILDMKDIIDYLNDRDFDRAKMTRYLAILAKFLIRLSKLMGDSTPATIDPLISSCLEYLKEWPGVKSLYLARAINHEQIESLDHYGIKYLNGLIGLGLASILTSEESSHRYKYNHQNDWHPLETSCTHSTIELLAHVELYGAVSLAVLPGVVYNDLPLTTRVLIAFSEVKLESYDNARDMLGPILDEVKGIYGSQSMEVFLVSATLVNCLNRCRMEALVEGLVNLIFGKAVRQSERPTIAQELLIKLTTTPDYYSNSELSVVVAFADSLLGQGKHDDALSLFQAILKKRRPDRGNIIMSVALRIAKITRRLNIKSSTDDFQSFDHSGALEVLRNVSEFYPRVSSILKYAYVEEVICHLSLLEDVDTRQRFVASEIIKVLNLESIPYKGSESSRISFFENLQTINQYAEQLKFLMADGAPEFLASNMAQRFPNASVDLIKKISRASWQRFNRIQEMRVMPEIDDIPDAKESLNYRDSGLGSSIKTTSNILESSNNSVVSYRSFMNKDAKSTTLPQMPETVKSEGQFLCFVCEKTIKGITGEAQYRRHIWTDLRPYVCPIKGCDADANQFLSRTDFGVHLKDHRATKSLGNKSTEHISTLRCPFCDELPGEVALIGHICHHLEELSCSVISQETGEELEKNGLDMTLIRRSNEDTREALLKHAELANTNSLFKNAWTDTRPITQYTEMSDNNDKWTDQAFEPLRDRHKWKIQGLNRLRDAWLSEVEVKKLERGGEMSEEDVKWKGKGEGSEWDRGKVVRGDGPVGFETSTEITGSLVDSLAPRDLQGNETSYASNQPASASPIFPAKSPGVIGVWSSSWGDAVSEFGKGSVTSARTPSPVNKATADANDPWSIERFDDYSPKD
ncbi:hypothetical protein BTUL_0084g00510 [Botrytis tulipae]|uniref:C2H2-type domain-containing protein n=1 Tax=Botrytis tulipae TaxID=87230 RepID=A0A4Z1EPK2_9HELO|nr:hypothetical protein BTUL_0084g00510 [Botrytis tulipae]